MKLIFVDESWEDYLYWQKTDRKILERINNLVKDISRNPYSGLGKPEPALTMKTEIISFNLGVTSC